MEGRERPRCARCRYVLYSNPASASAGVVLDPEGRVLLVRRAIDPWRGAWALPAGYQEVDEQPARTAEREVREETGLEVRAHSLLDLLFVPEDSRKPANLALYLCRVVGGTLCAGDDALDARFFHLDDLPAEVGFENRARILDRLREHPLYQRHLQDMSERTQPRPGASRPVSYKDAGVHIENKYDAVERAKASIQRTFTPGVVGDIGSFGGLFDLARAGVGKGLLVASADGVGTKLEVAKRARVYDTVGRDLVQHCINDILVQGARPLFFMDYVAVGKLEPEMVAGLIAGCANACAANGLALLGGETAEMPGLYAVGDFDLAGFIVGIVEPERLLDGSRVRPGQVLLGLRSAGLHTNGYSLARKLVFDVLGLELDSRPDELGGATVAEALLAEHRSYYGLLWPLLERGLICAMAHITGGGLVDNLPRVLGACDAWIDRGSWQVPALFRMLRSAGQVPDAEAYQVFNMGIGMVLIVEAERLEEVLAALALAGEEAFQIGHTRPSEGSEPSVRWS